MLSTTWAPYASSIAAVIISAISMTCSVILNRRSAHANSEIENLKHKLQNENKKRDLELERFNKIIEALRDAIQTIQSAKDAVQLILNCIENTLSTQSARSLMELSRKTIFESYERNMCLFVERDRKAVHNAKNIILSIEEHIQEITKNQDYVMINSEAHKRTLRYLRDELSESQHLLRDSLVKFQFDQMKAVQIRVMMINPNPPSVLVVDDNAVCLKVCARYGKLLGFRFEGAMDPITALNKIKETKFNIVLTDYHLPTMDGMELIAEIRKIDASVKIYISTAEFGLTEQEDVNDFLKIHNVAGILSKPTKEADLISLLNNYKA